MNLYTPYLVHSDEGTRVVRSYELFFIDVKDQFLVDKRTKFLSIEEIKLGDHNFYSGFLIQGTETLLDLRVNEGIAFKAGSVPELKLQIENYLHSYALDEEKARVLQLKRNEKSQSKI